jgi:hypothetical protein
MSKSCVLKLHHNYLQFMVLLLFFGSLFYVTCVQFLNIKKGGTYAEPQVMAPNIIVSLVLVTSEKNFSLLCVSLKFLLRAFLWRYTLEKVTICPI